MKSEIRTRFLPKLTNGEVEEHLETNNIIFVPVGVTETHGALPLDVETVIAEAFALKMAEEVNGLVLPNLPYFFAGATPVGKGTIQMSLKDGTSYLDKIAKSLLNQGFRRQIYLSLHGPAYLTISPMIRDFFDQTKVPILYIDLTTALDDNIKAKLFKNINEISVGSYLVLDRLEDVPLNIKESNSVNYELDDMSKAMKNHPAGPLKKLAYESGAVGYYFEKPADHMFTPLLKTTKDREELAKKGVEVIEEIVKSLDMTEIIKALKKSDEYTQDVSMKKYGENLPR